MSIEAALAALTAELKRNSDLLETITATAAKNLKAAAPADEKAPVDKPAGARVLDPGTRRMRMSRACGSVTA